jgi:hypothetical protein
MDIMLPEIVDENYLKPFYLEGQKILSVIMSDLITRL